MSCTRRSLFKGMAALVVIPAVLPGCAQQGSSLPYAKTSSTGGTTTIDLADPANSVLGTVGGAMLYDTSGDTVMVIRASSTSVVALSAICTHAGCSMDFDMNKERLTCPCHGSEFTETGAVAVGPARQPLRVYTASMANNSITVG